MTHQRRRCPAADGASRRARRQSRGGFTLIEVLLVVAVLAALAAISYSGIANFGDSQRMRRVADDARGMIAGLRVKAMDEGIPYQLAYHPQTGDYLIRKSGVDSAELQQQPLIGPMRGDGFGVIGAHRLEDGMIFMQVDIQSATPPKRPIDLEADGYVVQTFQPDGSCDDFILAVRDIEGYAVTVLVYGRTGRMVASNPTNVGPQTASIQGALP